MTKADLIAALADLADDAEIYIIQRGKRDGIAGIAEAEVVSDKDDLISEVHDDGTIVYTEPYAALWSAAK